MKKILPLLLLFCSTVAFSQFWIDVSLKGGAGPDFLINANVFNDDSLIHKFAMGNTFSGKLGFNFGDIHSLNIDVSSTGFTQGFQNKRELESGVPVKQLDYRTIDFAILYRKLFEGRYIEIGPMYSTANEITVESPTYGVLGGFGRTLAGSDRFAINLGCRARYVISNTIPEIYEPTYFGTTYAESKSSTNFSLLVMLEIDWAVGVFRRSTCYRNRLRFITF